MNRGIKWPMFAAAYTRSLGCITDVDVQGSGIRGEHAGHQRELHPAISRGHIASSHGGWASWVERPNLPDMSNGPGNLRWEGGREGGRERERERERERVNTQIPQCTYAGCALTIGTRG